MVTVIVYLLKSAQRRLPGYISLLSLCCRYGVRLSCYIVLGFCACMAVWWSMSAALYSPATLLSTAVLYCSLALSRLPVLIASTHEPFLTLRSLDSSKQMLRNGMWQSTSRGCCCDLLYNDATTHPPFPFAVHPPYTRRFTSRMTTRAVSQSPTSLYNVRAHLLSNVPSRPFHRHLDC